MSKTQELFEKVTEKIISNLESAGSWQKLWSHPTPTSLNGHQYSGINYLMLATDSYQSPIYGTFKMISENGGRVMKGEKSSIIVFWDRAKEKDDQGLETGDSYFFLKYYSVFNVAQANWDDLGKAKIAAMEEELGKKHRERIQSAEDIIGEWKDKPTILHDKSGRASYSRVIDRIRLPEIGYFETSDEYYATLFHECIHATGHRNRLNRFGEYREFNEDMMHNYSKEELVAELGASYLAAVANLNHDYRNSAAYIKGWSERLKENTNWLMWAAKRAQKAANLILFEVPQPKGKEAEYVN